MTHEKGRFFIFLYEKPFNFYLLHNNSHDNLNKTGKPFLFYKMAVDGDRKI